MKMTQWLKPGIKVKRWILFGIMGILLIVFGIIEFLNKMYYNVYYITFFIFLIVCGIFTLYISINQGMKSVIALINQGYLKLSFDSKKLGNLIYEKRLLVKGPKIVVIGGGTGLSTMLRGLKYYTSNITAIVTVGDDGGGSGALREDLGILPPGDIRNCILALADTEPLMEDLLQYRFLEGRLKGQSFGNLFLAAMDGISDNFEDAIQKMSSVLAVTGKVLPVTLDDMILKAKLENGTVVEGESNIPREALKQNSKIDRIFIEPENAKALREAVQSIKEADAIILGPGSLYTSIMPNLLVKDISNAIKKTKALKIYVCNIMTQPGETDEFSVSDHIKAVHKHVGEGMVNYTVVNNGEITDELIGKYKLKTSHIVSCDDEELKNMNINVVKGDFIKVRKGLIRHDAEKLSSILIETIMDKQLFYDRKKILEYFYLSERLKENRRERS
ncbi:gluconeogenesis factor YvcK family protein [Haloimpatiens lingqiaonensis]|uniref:gluconeogenesis factor YvcK family protein n=1 Tax=Haloimpatiens lingqiaonensis TaxID=1380675 RepID=UPI0010FDD2A6|nr:gluconeogenesis factor YvcK family protein [Haloimpatiens lingqiaonensis]